MSLSEFPGRNTGADQQQAGDRSYRIGLCAAKSMANAGQEAERFADEMRRWLMLSPATPAEPVEGTVLDLAAARKAAVWRHFADPVMRVVFVICVVVIILTIVERDWWQAVELIGVLGMLIVVQLRSLRKWYETAPGLLPWLPAAGTRVAVGSTALVVGDATIPYEQIRFDHIRLRKARGFNTRYWEFEYFLDHATLIAGGKIIHLDATAIGNGQLILDTLCSRVPLTAFGP